jgi:taurine dioxygenase
MKEVTVSARTTKSSPLPVSSLSAALGGEVTGMDVREISADMLRETLAKYGVLAFRDQNLTSRQFVEIGRRLGELEYHVLDQYRMQDDPEVYVISNIVENGVPLGNPKEGFGWHTDLSYMSHPTAYTLLYGVEVPDEGADTLFCNTREALNGLSPDLKERVEHLKAVHSYVFMRMGNADYRRANQVKEDLRKDQIARVPDVIHPVVRTHPVDGTRSLYLGGDCLARFVDMNPEESKQLASLLLEHVREPQFRYAHKWRKNDVVIWDNRFTMHTATEYDRDRYRRLIWRISVRGESPV